MIRDTYNGSLDVTALHRHYRAGELTIAEVVESVLARIQARGEDSVWISRVPPESLRQRARELDTLRSTVPDLLQHYPLYGIPFAVKDNIDVAGMETTVACPAYAYTAQGNATVVRKLLDAGALLVGKTNLDQFATGLVGTRSPYGIPLNPFHPDYIPGGSSSGSAVAVAAGLAGFALGTDTAGSGRVPAALNNIVGLKPTRGMLSTAGVVPTCRSLDCVSVFAATCADALAVMAVAAGYDPTDPYSRRSAARQRPGLTPCRGPFRCGVPGPAYLEFSGDGAAARCYAEAVQRLRALGGQLVEIDFAPFRRAAEMLYQGPWVAERYFTVGEILTRAPEAIHPDVRQAIVEGKRYSAMDAFAAQYRLKALQREVQGILADVDCLVLPSVGRTYRIAEVLADPLDTNTRLGYYTNFVNLLDLCAVAVPTDLLPEGLPFGVTLVGPPHSEGLLCALGDRLHRDSGLSIGATKHPLPAPAQEPAAAQEGYMLLCVCGAHMSGLPLNPQLLKQGGRFWARTRTAPRYRLYAMEHMQPPRPGMVRAEDGVALEVEVWELPREHFGDFMACVPPPLSIGAVELETGQQVYGFLCESYALRQARDISGLGGWRAYLASTTRA